MSPLVEPHLETIAEICKRHFVRELNLFGSAARDDFDEGSSDIDFLVDFDPTPSMSAADQYFGTLESLRTLLRREVDLVTVQSLRNPYLIRSVNESRLRIYAP